tara:strand:+ start:702 stop:1919 length:1218 start_codon:yes stop_codon:yes gene_type:complete
MIEKYLSKIDIIAGNDINYVLKKKSIGIFDTKVIDFLSEFSSIILSNLNNYHELREFAGFAFWIRKANLLLLKKQYSNLDNRFGRGIAFHISPSNVVTNALYTFAFGLLSGCPSIIRISGSNKDVIKTIMSLIQTSEMKDKYLPIMELYSFITYIHSDKINNYLSKNVDLRLLWGGNETIKLFKAYQTKHNCIDLPFPDRTSSAYIEMQSLNKIKGNELENIATRLANDIFIFSQRACSSPLYIFSNCKKSEEKNLVKFLKIVNKSIKNISNTSSGFSRLDHFKGSADLALNIPHKGKSLLISDYLTVFKIEDFSVDSKRRYKPFNGCLIYIPIDSIEQMPNFLDPSNQTTILVPFNENLARDIMTIVAPLGTNRIVGAGNAVNMHLFWDGYDIVSCLSKNIKFY